MPQIFRLHMLLELHVRLHTSHMYLLLSQKRNTVQSAYILLAQLFLVGQCLLLLLKSFMTMPMSHYCS